MDLLIEFAKIGMGIAYVVREFVPKELSDRILTQLPLPAPVPKREIGFAYAKNTILMDAIKKFIEQARIKSGSPARRF